MMGRALLVIGLLATLILGVTAGLGYRLAGPTDESLRFHVLAALAASLLLVFSHCWILLYLIVVGRAIRTALQENGLALPQAAEVERLKGRSFPLLLTALATAIATFATGGAAATGSLALLHHLLFYVTFLCQLAALWSERRVLTANQGLIAEISRRLAPAESA
ncbi:MAG TPA: hypothetical protein VMM92_06905 [Thermoanaerobaculia bacterium]|nr:hypothetical protein [Thermoanaerobaculia bacterium]